MAESDDVRKCIGGGGVAVDPDWLRRQAREVREARAIISELLACPAMLRVRPIRDAVGGYVSNTLDLVEGALDDAAASLPIRDALQSEVSNG